ncbi:glycosyltransferase family 4 protein [Noviherbaspirillum malthae]|uniref:glycosyltransferase family 4 protein n=1 Tax=Noviherbaspirillum malthae TaxID=1260987 RepID=UPI00188DD3E6|nr:glycosyltransferase family 4 protein [Noviherbaspirillum malthae]
MITQLFDPENSIKGLEFARRLKRVGHDVEVVTTFPSYPGGKIFPGYKQSWKKVDLIDGIKVVRLPTFVSHGRSAAKRMLSYVSFGLIATLYSMFRAKKPDVIYAYYPPLIVGFVALCVGTFRKVPFVYDVQDLWPDALIATGMVKEGLVTRMVDRLCNTVYRRAARIVVLSDGYKNALVTKKVPTAKLERIYNWCDEARMDVSTTNTRVLDKNFFNILYAGNLGAAQALEHVIDAAHLLKRSDSPMIRFVFIGAGVKADNLKSRVETLGLDNVQFLPPVSLENISGVLGAADVLLVHLADEPVFEITIPSKTQAYLMQGKPILMAVRGEAAQIIVKAQAGIAVDPCNPKQLAEAAIAMSTLASTELCAMGARGRAFYQKHMSMAAGVQNVDTMLKAIKHTAN